MKKHDLPAMPFYFGDWLKCPEVRALDLDVRMVWFEMLGLMWESTERGYLTINGKPVSDSVITKILGILPDVLDRALRQMEEYGVFSRRDDGAIYCRRMIKDEAIRQAKSKAGKQGMDVRYSKSVITGDITKCITDSENETAIETATATATVSGFGIEGGTGGNGKKALDARQELLPELKHIANPDSIIELYEQRHIEKHGRFGWGTYDKGNLIKCVTANGWDKTVECLDIYFREFESHTPGYFTKNFGGIYDGTERDKQEKRGTARKTGSSYERAEYEGQYKQPGSFDDYADIEP